jgi:hypothetical protein
MLDDEGTNNKPKNARKQLRKIIPSSGPVSNDYCMNAYTHQAVVKQESNRESPGWEEAAPLPRSRAIHGL